MTAAERQRKRRQRLGIGGPWLSAYRPWDGTRCDNRRETETIEHIAGWLENGDMNAVTEWLVGHLWGRAWGLDRVDVLELIDREWRRLDAEAIESDKLRLARDGLRYPDISDEEFERLRGRVEVEAAEYERYLRDEHASRKPDGQTEEP